MSYSLYIQKQIALYKSLQPCFCPAIQETVCFNAEGLKHLFYDKKHRPRNHDQKHYRVSLIDYITEVITTAQKAVQESYATPPCKLWILEYVVIDTKGQKHYIKVIVRKKGNGNVHFLSVMEKRHKNGRKTKKPKL